MCDLQTDADGQTQRRTRNAASVATFFVTSQFRISHATWRRLSNLECVSQVTMEAEFSYYPGYQLSRHLVQ